MSRSWPAAARGPPTLGAGDAAGPVFREVGVRDVTSEAAHHACHFCFDLQSADAVMGSRHSRKRPGGCSSLPSPSLLQLRTFKSPLLHRAQRGRSSLLSHPCSQPPPSAGGSLIGAGTCCRTRGARSRSPRLVPIPPMRRRQSTHGHLQPRPALMWPNTHSQTLRDVSVPVSVF